MVTTAKLNCFIESGGVGKDPSDLLPPRNERRRMYLSSQPRHFLFEQLYPFLKCAGCHLLYSNDDSAVAFFSFASAVVPLRIHGLSPYRSPLPNRAEERVF
jgi:hypothetical protein